MKNKKYFDGGNILSLLGGATNLIPKDNAAGGAASGAINGASSLAATGNPYLIGAGALIGGVAGGIQGNKQNIQNQINPYTDGISDRNNFLNIMADGGLIEYNTGGTHEQNPLGGIPQGIAPGGQTNTVEEGETRLKDFIFSDRLKVNKSMAKKFNLPDKFIGKSFADVSKIYNKELEARPNDPYAKKTADLNMNNLMLANQEVASKKMTNILADGGYLSPSQYSQQMQTRDFNPAIPMMEPIVDQLPQQKLDLNTQLAGMPTTFLGTARKNWPIQDQNLLNTPNMPDRTSGINPQMVSEGQQARGYNQNVENYLRDVGRIVNQSQISGDTRSQDDITRDIVGDYDKQPLTTVPFPKTFGKGGQIQHATNPFLEIKKDPYDRDSGYNEVQYFGKKYDPLNVFSWANEQYRLPISGISQPNNISGPSTTLLGNTQAKNGNIGDFYDPSNPSLPFEGYKPASGSDWTRRGYMGNDFNTQNEWVKGQLSPENIKMWLDPESELNKGVPWRQNYINIIKQQQPKLYEDLLAGKVPADKLQELYTEEEVGPIQSLVDFPQKPLGSVKDPDITPPPNIPPPPSITTEKGKITIPPTTQTTKTPGTSMKVPNLWSEAGTLSALPYAFLHPELANPTLISTGNIKAPKYDELTGRARLDAANSSSIGALTGATGGNAAALRAGLLGQSGNYMDATSDLFTDIHNRNNMSQYETDKANKNSQDQFAQINQNYLNQFELENKQLINNINAKKADEFANTMSDYVGNASNRRAVRELTNARANDIFNATGYAPTIPQTTMNLSKGTPGIPNHQLTWDEWNKSKNPQELASNVNFSCGGVIKTRRRGLK